MVGHHTEYKVATLFQTISNGEKDIEISRQVLAERSAFEPYTAFKRLTRLDTSNLTVYQVVDFLRENNFTVLERDVRNVFRAYSTSPDGRLTYTDFLELVLPRTNTVLREIATQRDSYHVAEDEILPYEVELGLAKILDKEVNLSRKVELLKEDLVSRYDFNLRTIHEIVAEAGEGRIDYDALYAFLQKNNISVIERDVVALLRRTDVDRDGRLSYSEFTESVLPIDEYQRKLAQSPNLPRKVASPTRLSVSPSRVASAHRTNKSISGTTNVFSPSSKKLTNYDYYSYVSESNRKSATLRKSLSPTRTTRAADEASYSTPTRTKNVASPSRTKSPSRLEPTSPMKGNEEEQLAKGLREQIENDQELENARNKLALQDDFNLFDAFRLFDLTEKGFVTRLELREGLNDLDVFPSTNEMYLIMKKYNKDEDGLLKYSEFCDLIRPKDAGYAQLLGDRKPTYADRVDLSDVFSRYTIECMRRVVNKVVENEFHSEKVRQRLARRPLFDNYEAFEALDKDGKGYLNKNEFRELLSGHGIYTTQKELQTLVTRYDRNEDGKVSYTDFVREITPQSPERV